MAQALSGQRARVGGEPRRELKVLVSSGGTVTPIDDIRVIANRSHGRTGAEIAEGFLQRGHTLRYLGGAGALKPFGRLLSLDPSKEISDELVRLRRDGKLAKRLLSNAELKSCETFDQYSEALGDGLRGSPDVTVLAMAANDYAPEYSTGKIPSDTQDLSLHLHRLPKLIKGVKSASPSTFLVGFKHEVDVAPDCAVESAYRSLLANHEDIVVANIDRPGIPRSDMQTFIVTRERGVIPVERGKLANKLVEIVEERVSKDHFSTHLTKLFPEDFNTVEVKSFMRELGSISNLALFPNYNPGDRREFGFLARRDSTGFLITSRGSSKTEASYSDVAHIDYVDFDKQIVNVTSTGTKGSLNAPLAELIFRLRPEIKYVVHSHIVLPSAASTKVRTSPGTVEDCKSIEALVASGEDVIYQPDHGVLILMEDLNQLRDKLGRFSIYHQRPELYDLAYHRFTRRSRLIDLFEEHVSKDGAVLDMAAGTGQVTKQLLSRGYRNITLVDRSPGMLDFARKELPQFDASVFSVSAMEDYKSDKQYDGIVLRQAINYLNLAQLERAFKNFRSALAPGGKLIFNTFNSDVLPPAKVPLKRDIIGDNIVLTLEANHVEGDIITHAQRTEIFNQVTGGYDQVYDLNSFYRHPLGTYVEALKQAGFSEIRTIVEGASIYVIAE